VSAPIPVSELTRALADLFADLGEVQVVGEVSQFTAHRSGHWYFTLQEGGASLSAVMFRFANQRQRFQPAPGDRVVARGRMDLYAPQGRYNLVAQAIERVGEGSERERVEAIKRRLQAEGLLDPGRKRPLPAMPRAVGVATSATGAALQDVLKVLWRRFPGVVVYFAPCRVQGAGAAEEVAAALRLLEAHGQSEVIIVGRGGGSAEDLAAFQDEGLARAIAACRVPVVSAVGHEVDFSVADLVADVRAATPSHAAELVVPMQAELQERVAVLRRRLDQAMQRELGRRRQQLVRVRLRDPRRRVAEARLRNDELADALLAAARRDLAARRRRVAAVAGRLDALSPLAVLSRGYALALRDGVAVRAARELSAGDRLLLRLHEGEAAVEVI
jgi:exodeoxyribonuclease VII large subunit